LCKHYTNIQSYMQVILSFVDESVEKTSSRKRNHYFDALETYTHDDINYSQQVWTMKTFIIHWNFFLTDDKALLLYLCAKIYIPLLDKGREHRILAVINFIEKRKYYLNSLGPSNKAITLAYELVIIIFLCAKIYNQCINFFEY